MAKPPAEIGKRDVDMLGPHRVSVAFGKPWCSFVELGWSGCECDAIGQIGTTVAQRKELGLQ
jgi:hypothetical protein